MNKVINMPEYNNDAKGIVELPLTPKEMDILRGIYSKFVVELEAQDVSRPEALSAIIKVQGDNKNISPFWVLKNFINNDEFKIIKDGGMIRFISYEDEEVSPSNEEKGGEKMTTKKDFTNKMTSGEEKVAKAVIDHFKEGFKIKNPSRELFENCLNTAFPKIKNGKAATTNLINKKWLKEVDGKIFIGPKGEKYLSP